MYVDEHYRPFSLNLVSPNYAVVHSLALTPDTIYAWTFISSEVPTDIKLL